MDDAIVYGNRTRRHGQRSEQARAGLPGLNYSQHEALLKRIAGAAADGAELAMLARSSVAEPARAATFLSALERLFLSVGATAELGLPGHEQLGAAYWLGLDGLDSLKEVRHA